MSDTFDAWWNETGRAMDSSPPSWRGPTPGWTMAQAAYTAGLKRASRVLLNRERIAEPQAQMCSVREVIVGCRRAVERDMEIDAATAPSVVAGTVPPTCGKTGPHCVNGVCPYCGEDPALSEWTEGHEHECGSCGKAIMALPSVPHDGSWRFAGVYTDDGDEMFNPDGTRVRAGEAAGVPGSKEGE